MMLAIVISVTLSSIPGQLEHGVKTYEQTIAELAPPLSPDGESAIEDIEFNRECLTAVAYLQDMGMRLLTTRTTINEIWGVVFRADYELMEFAGVKHRLVCWRDRAGALVTATANDTDIPPLD